MTPFIYVDDSGTIYGMSTVDIGLPYNKQDISEEIFTKYNNGEITFDDIIVEDGTVFIKESEEHRIKKRQSQLDEILIEKFEDHHSEFDPVYLINTYQEEFYMYDLVVIHDEKEETLSAWAKSDITNQITMYVADKYNPYKLYGTLVVGPDKENSVISVNNLSDFALYINHVYRKAKFIKVAK